MDDSDRRLIEGLEKRLVWYREEASEEEFDAEEVDAICTILQKLSPSIPDRTKDEAYQGVMRRLRLEEAGMLRIVRDGIAYKSVPGVGKTIKEFYVTAHKA